MGLLGPAKILLKTDGDKPFVAWAAAVKASRKKGNCSREQPGRRTPKQWRSGTMRQDSCRADLDAARSHRGEDRGHHRPSKSVASTDCWCSQRDDLVCWRRESNSLREDHGKTVPDRLSRNWRSCPLPVIAEEQRTARSHRTEVCAWVFTGETLIGTPEGVVTAVAVRRCQR